MNSAALGLFKDDGRFCFANISYSDGSSCLVSVAQNGILVKKGSGIFGRKLWKSSTDRAKFFDETLPMLDLLEAIDLTPSEMNTKGLKAVTNIALLCKNLEELETALNDGNEIRKLASSRQPK